MLDNARNTNDGATDDEMMMLKTLVNDVYA